MWFYLGVSILIGVSLVLQSGINSSLAQTNDLSSALFINSVVVLVLSILLLALAWFKPQLFPEMLRPTQGLPDLKWTLLLPGLFGFIIILGFPMAMSFLGAVRVLAVVITVQLIVGLLWDQYVVGIDWSWMRLIGCFVTLIGALLTLI
jgi:transporter family-2 protein